MTSSRLSALAQGLLWYAGTYVFLVHLFVAWKWETTEIEELIPKELINLPLPDFPSSEFDRLDALQDLLEDMREEGTHRNIPQLDTILDGYQKTLRNWDYWDTNNNTSDVLLPDGQKTIKIVSLKHLLQKASLSEIDTKNLNTSFQMTLRELRGLSDRKADVRWNMIGEYLLLSQSNATQLPGEFPDKKKLSQGDLYEQICVLTNLEEEEDSDEEGIDEDEDEEEDDNEVVDTFSFLTQDDLDTHYQVLQAVLGQRNESIQDYLRLKINDTITSVLSDAIGILGDELRDAQLFTDESIAQAKHRILAATSSGDSPAAAEEEEPMECVAPEDVMAFVEAGLEALKRRRDLRAALLKTLQEIDPPAAEELILDADLLGTDPPLPETTVPSINLRRLIDQPLLPHLMGGIDNLLEVVRGYTDELDPYIEKLCQCKLDKGGSLGKIVTEYLLHATGKARVPIQQELQRTLMEKPEGRKLLALF